MRNIKLSPTRNNKIQSISYDNSNYFYYSTQKIANPSKENLNYDSAAIKEDRLKDFANIAFKHYKTIPKIIEFILKEVKEDNEYCDVVKLSKLHKAINSVILSSVSYNYELIDNFSINGANQLNDNNSVFIQFINKTILININNIYIQKNKICSNEAKLYQQVIFDYFKDILLNQSKSLSHYLGNGYNFVFKDSTDLRKHKTRIEYLIKLCKNDLKTNKFF